MKTVIRRASPVAVLLLIASPLFAQDGPSVYRAACASCHDAGIDKAPSRAALMTMTPERVLASLESGSMISMTAARSASERRAVAEFVTGKAFKQPLVTRPAPQTMCTAAQQNASAAPLAGPSWNGWGVTSANTRFQDAAAGLTAASVPRLKLKWAFGFPGDIAADAQPTVAGGRGDVGRHSGHPVTPRAARGWRPGLFSATGAPRAAPTLQGPRTT